MVHTVAVRRRRALLAALAGRCLAPAACSDDGRTLAPIRPGQTTTTDAARPRSSTAARLRAGERRRSATAARSRSSTPATARASPAASRWASAPAGAELALVVRDRDADGYVHWIVTGIDPTISGFGDGRRARGRRRAGQHHRRHRVAPAVPAGGLRAGTSTTSSLHVLAAPLDDRPRAARRPTVATPQIEAASISPRRRSSGTVDPDDRGRSRAC